MHIKLVEKPKGKRSLGIQRHKEDNFYIGSERKRVGGYRLIHLAQNRIQRDALMNTATGFLVP
jgi:hypothetical protein